MTAISLDQLTDKNLTGSGVFDTLMGSIRSHLTEEYREGRINGADYSNVYLGAMTAAMQQSVAFLLTKEKAGYEADLVSKQVDATDAGITLTNKQVEAAQAEIDISTKQGSLIDEQILKTVQETSLLTQQVMKSVSEKALLDAQVTKTSVEEDLIEKDVLRADSEISLLAAQTSKLGVEESLLVQEEAKKLAETNLTNEQTTNATKEFEVLHAQKCKLDAEFDVLISQKPKVDAEKELLLQKILTELAQVSATGVDENSVIGKQKALYTSQSNGFTRDAEQKATKLMVDAWNVQRTTDPDVTAANGTNKLDDTNIGRAVTKLLDGINA